MTAAAGTWWRDRNRAIVGAALAGLALIGAIVLGSVLGSGPAIPDVVGEDLAYTRGAMASADLEYDVVEVAVEDPDQDGIVQAATYNDETERVDVEVGTLPTITISGTFTLVDDPLLESSMQGRPCSGTGGYSDFGDGMNVTVRDGDGAIIATTSTMDSAWSRIDGVGGVWCRTHFEVDADIVDFYAITVGRRGELSYSYDELRALDFKVDLTLG